MKVTSIAAALALTLGLLAPPAYAVPTNSSRNFGEISTVRLLNGTPTYLGTITATTTKNNNSTASPFTIPLGQFVLVQCDAATYVLPGTTTGATVTTSNGVKIIADEKYYLMLTLDQAYLAALAVTGTVNCKVWRMD